ncbi:hypothetical protein [Caproiciproducens sp.]|uniref:hypothetical protein n=1 Tax=Caproiciproducens sp. TaxID=1954376 RepID=UPI002899E096|nr:hypothetical protein [Caproiciproducens sp.]
MSMTGFTLGLDSTGDYSRHAARGRSLRGLVTDSTYDEAGAAPEFAALRVFDPEYRILKAWERMRGEFSCSRKQLYGMMKNFLSSANGSSSYTIKTETVFNRLKEYGNPEDANLIPVTLVACKIQAGRVCCSVERLFYRCGERALPAQVLRGALYCEHPEQLAEKFRNLDYPPFCVIGKGDFAGSLRKIFSKQFGFIVS